MARKHSKKRQTRISFDPVSPDARYATVTYEGSPAKKRKANGQQKLDFELLRSDGPSSSSAAAIFGPPTPARSSQVTRSHDRSYNVDDDGDDDDGRNLTDSDSDNGVVRPTRQRGRGRREEPTSSIFSRAAIISPKTEKVAMHSSRGKQKGPDLEDNDADESDEDDEPITPSKTPMKARSPKSRRQKPVVQVISSEEDDGAPNGSSEDSDEDVQPITPIRRQAAGSSSKREEADVGDDEDEDDDDVRPSTQRRRAQTPPKATNTDSEEEVTHSPRKRLTRRGQAKQQTPPSSNTPLNQGNESESVNEEPDGEVQEVLSRKKLSRRRVPSGDDDDSEAAEMAAEAKDLKKSTVFHKHKGGRLRDRTGNSKVNDRRNRLEQLKARREGRVAEVSEDEDEDDDEGVALDDQDENDFPGSDAEEDDFVINDDEESRARYDAGDSVEHIELELMRHGQRSLKEHFMYVVKGMIAARLNPGEPQEVKQLYETSTKRVNREASGLADRLVSTVWVEPFLRVIRARPDYQEMELGGFDREVGSFGGRCSACDRSGHPPSFVAVLKGKAYSRDKLEPLKDDDDDDADETSEDEEGHKLVDEDREWHLGSFCRSNAINAHSLIHWRIHLRDWLNAYLEAGHYFSTAAIVKRDRMSTKKRSKVVETIMDELEASKQIRRLWNEFKAKCVAAPEVKGQRWGRP